eukprot:943922-Prorocentrum_minimum.AAC.1
MRESSREAAAAAAIAAGGDRGDRCGDRPVTVAQWSSSAAWTWAERSRKLAASASTAPSAAHTSRCHTKRVCRAASSCCCCSCCWCFSARLSAGCCCRSARLAAGGSAERTVAVLAAFAALVSHLASRLASRLASALASALAATWRAC